MYTKNPPNKALDFEGIDFDKVFSESRKEIEAKRKSPFENPYVDAEITKTLSETLSNIKDAENRPFNGIQGCLPEDVPQAIADQFKNTRLRVLNRGHTEEQVLKYLAFVEKSSEPILILSRIPGGIRSDIQWLAEFKRIMVLPLEERVEALGGLYANQGLKAKRQRESAAKMSQKERPDNTERNEKIRAKARKLLGDHFHWSNGDVIREIISWCTDQNLGLEGRERYPESHRQIRTILNEGGVFDTPE